MRWAGMPETPIDEDRETEFGKVEIGPSIDRDMPTPSHNAVEPKSFANACSVVTFRRERIRRIKADR
jgi:hypothetical protein